MFRLLQGCVLLRIILWLVFDFLQKGWLDPGTTIASQSVYMNAVNQHQSWLKMIEALSQSEDWTPNERPIEIVHSHISAVLLGKKHVLKLKKPINLGFLDYTTLEKRRLACEAELELNRRLSPDVYLSLETVREKHGDIHVGGDGRIVDYAVRMKRLPADRMLDRLVAGGEVTEQMIDRIADRLSAFHKSARRDSHISSFGTPQLIRKNWDENFEQTTRYIDRTISKEAYHLIRSRIFEWLESNDQLLQARITDGRICEGHGDIRAESICVANGLSIFDCIEFNERFRFADVASEIAFLSMDLDARGRPDLGYYFAQRYSTLTDDSQLPALLPFYKCYRAYVRGKVMNFRLDADEFSERERKAAALRARRFFDLSRRYIDRLPKKTIVMVAGLSGTGKTSVARAVASELGYRVVSSDEMRKQIFSIEEPPAYGVGPYSTKANRKTYDRLIEQARESVITDGGVVLDATFKHETDRDLVSRVADELGSQLRIIECHLEPEIVRERLARRAKLREGLSDANWDTHVRQRSEFLPFDHQNPAHLVLDTKADLGVVAHIATDWLRG